MQTLVPFIEPEGLWEIFTNTTKLMFWWVWDIREYNLRQTKRNLRAACVTLGITRSENTRKHHEYAQTLKDMEIQYATFTDYFDSRKKTMEVEREHQAIQHGGPVEGISVNQFRLWLNDEDTRHLSKAEELMDNLDAIKEIEAGLNDAGRTLSSNYNKAVQCFVRQDVGNHIKIMTGILKNIKIDGLEKITKEMTMNVETFQDAMMSVESALDLERQGSKGVFKGLKRNASKASEKIQNQFLTKVVTKNSVHVPVVQEIYGKTANLV